MNPQLLYLYDPLILEFETEIRELLELPNGNLGVILTSNYFYPTGGGQEHDTGSLGSAQVLEAFKSADGEAVILALDHHPGKGHLRAAIDRGRRLRHMQHHTGQHLLSACFERLLGLGTLSSGIHGETPTTIDLPDADLSTADLAQVEEIANRIIFENRTVKSYFVPAAQIASVPFRRPPKVTGEIRVVEIDGWDYSACGATHCPQTGMIGLLKIVRTERVNQKLRIHFVAGQQALDYFRQVQEIATALATDFSTHPGEVVDLVRRQAAQLQAAQQELEKLRAAVSAYEAQDLNAQAEQRDSFRLAVRAFENRPANDLRVLGQVLKAQPDLVAVLAAYDGEKLALLVTCGQASGHSARAVLQTLLAVIGGRGGGDDQIAQGGGPASADQVQALLENTKEQISK